MQTPDDWHPAYNAPDVSYVDHRRVGGFVKVSFIHLTDGLYRVCVWGADDTGMELDQKSRMDAMSLYKSIPNPVTMKELTLLGFHSA